MKSGLSIGNPTSIEIQARRQAKGLMGLVD